MRRNNIFRQGTYLCKHTVAHWYAKRGYELFSLVSVHDEPEPGCWAVEILRTQKTRRGEPVVINNGPIIPNELRPDPNNTRRIRLRSRNFIRLHTVEQWDFQFAEAQAREAEMHVQRAERSARRAEAIVDNHVRRVFQASSMGGRIMADKLLAFKDLLEKS